MSHESSEPGHLQSPLTNVDEQEELLEPEAKEKVLTELKALCYGDQPLSVNGIQESIQAVIDAELAQHPEVQKMLFGLFDALFSNQVTKRLASSKANREKIFPFSPQMISAFLPFASHIEKKYKRQLKALIGEYITDLLFYCPSEEQLPETLQFCIQLCKVFNIGKDTAIKPKQVRVEIIYDLKKRFHIEVLKKLQKELGRLGIPLNPQNRKKSGGTRRNPEEEMQKNLERLRGRVGHNGAGGGHWLTG